MDEEEKQLEAAALAAIDPEVIKKEIIEEMGLDEVDDADKIEKFVAREVKSRTVASKAIGSKIKTRDELNKLKEKPETKVDPSDIDKAVDAKLEKRDLEALDYPDALKETIKKVASSQGISIKEALKDPYIKFKVDEADKEKAAEDASVGRTNKNGASKKFDFDKPPAPDMSTPEGQKEWDEWIAAAKAAGH